MPTLQITGDKRVLDAIREILKHSEVVNEYLNDNDAIEYQETFDLTNDLQIEEIA